MTANVVFRIFTIEIGDTPTLTFEAQNQREAQELCHEQWLKDDLIEAKSGGVPLWDGKADVGPMKVPEGLSDEQVLFLSDIFPTGYMAADFCDVIAIDTVPQRLQLAKEDGCIKMVIKPH